MSTERSTVRPVTLARLVELTHLCETEPCRTGAVEERLGVTRKRARETILEAHRIDLITEIDGEADESQYETTAIGDQFLTAIRHEDWEQTSNILATRSPHYKAFLEAVRAVGPAPLPAILDHLEEVERYSPHTYNQTSVEVVGDWAERLGEVQRNAFTGDYYPVEADQVPRNFPYLLLEVSDELEETAGVSLRQRYLSIPKLREFVCERISCTRPAFDNALTTLISQNIGKADLMGAPIDTGAKDAELGIKEITLSTDQELVSTTHSTEQVMQGVEQGGKQYYYLAVYDRDLGFTPEDQP